MHNSLWSKKMRLKWLRFGIACFWAATLPWSCSPHEHSMPVAFANETEAPRPTMEDVAAELVCDFPQCSREALTECTTCEYAIKYRKQIATQLEQGRSKEQIVEFFASTYGEQILGNPRHWSAAGIPYLAVLLGLVPLVLVLRSRQQSKNAGMPLAKRNPPTTAPTDDPRIQEALDNFKY